MTTEWRERIQTGVLLDRLDKHALGQVEMTATQINAAKILLAKAIPDLRAIEHSGEIATKYELLTDSELDAKIAAALDALRNPAKPGG